MIGRANWGSIDDLGWSGRLSRSMGRSSGPPMQTMPPGSFEPLVFFRAYVTLDLETGLRCESRTPDPDGPSDLSILSVQAVAWD